MSQIDKYLDYIRKELEMCENGKKWGRLSLEVHWKGGEIGGMWVDLRKYVKLELKGA